MHKRKWLVLIETNDIDDVDLYDNKTIKECIQQRFHGQLIITDVIEVK